MQPFSIKLFATTGNPEGIRHLDKSNWSSYGVVFNKELFHLLKQEPGFSQAGIYILVGNTTEKTIHIGKVEAILPYNDTGKYMIKFKGPTTAIVLIPRPKNSEVNMQSSRYALRKKLLAAKNLDQVWADVRK